MCYIEYLDTEKADKIIKELKEKGEEFLSKRKLKLKKKKEEKENDLVSLSSTTTTTSTI